MPDTRDLWREQIFLSFFVRNHLDFTFKIQITQGQLQIWTEHSTLIFENMTPVKSVHFKKTVAQSSFPFKSVVIFADFVLISVKMRTLLTFVRNCLLINYFLKFLKTYCLPCIISLFMCCNDRPYFCFPALCEKYLKANNHCKIQRQCKFQPVISTICV